MAGVTNSPLPLLRLILGDEDLLVARAISQTAACARATDPHADVQEHDARELVAGQLAEMVSPSLFGGMRVVVIRDAQDAKKPMTSALLEYASDPADDVCMMLAHAGGAKNKALADGFRTAGADVVTAARITRHRDRVKFVIDEVRALGGRCPEAAAEVLVSAVGSDLRELAAACAQLTADHGGRLTTEAIHRYYRGRAEVSGFTVADAAVVGDVPGALEALRWALAVGVDPVPIADALADGVRTLSRVASAGRGNPYQMASSLGMPAWKVEKAQRVARGWTPQNLAQAMHVAADLNAAVKGGSDDREYALERAVLAVAHARRDSARSGR
ncbi:MAG: DNA polymerase III subunit delta [Micromonosporaceae bacterium]